MLKKEFHAIVYGRVHAVGFRATTKQYADQLHLTGFVRNLPNGTVEICAQGEKKNFETLLTLLHQVFGPAHIRQIDVTFQTIKTSYTDFKIQ